MKRWLLLIVLVVGLSAAGTVAVQYVPEVSPEQGSGDVEVPLIRGANPRAEKGLKPKATITSGGPTTYQFDTMPQNVTGKHVWTVKNQGQGDLVLHMESSTCSCTIAKFKNGEDAVVKPGEETEIALEFETRTNNGDYKKGATIGTNDPDMPTFELAVHGKVFPAVMTFPGDPVLTYSTISNDEDDHKMSVAVFSKDRPETKVVKITTSSPQVESSHQPLTAAEAKTIPLDPPVKVGEKVTINVKSGFPLGIFKEEVVITTDHPKQPEVRLSVTGKMVGPVNLIPSTLVAHDVAGRTGGKGEATIVVRNHRATNFKVVKKPEALQAEVVPTDKPGRYKLVVTVPPGTPNQRLQDEVVLETDHPKAGKLIVPLEIWVHDVNTN
jgi:hypothetical protein